MSFQVFQRLSLLIGVKNINLCISQNIATLSNCNRIMLPLDRYVKMDVHVVHKNFFCNTRNFHKASTEIQKKGIQENISSLHAKKRPARLKKSITDEEKAVEVGVWNAKAFATAEEYNLECLMTGLVDQKLYTPKGIYTSTKSLPDVIHATASYEIGHEQREIFFFREGTVVMWNISDLESGNLIQFLKSYEQNGYSDDLIQTESELMTYSYADPGKKSHLKDGNIMLSADATYVDKYTFSNAMSQSVKLGIWEASLDHYVDSIEYVTEDLKEGRKLRMTQQQVLRKQGELFALRHLINLSSDLLDTPDFYWERDDLDNLYHQMCGYFSVAKRTKVINDKLNHCVELVGNLSTHLSDRHHVRLEWMIIILIMVEVGFEVLHYIDRYFAI